ncbi:MT-A70 family methyltransferase [uncultured Draconibacterium sp.]|uniref:MT-A70 family methyltransferase n=1 Tax=uncultured Draconibacterium sp. TaxID=1573823 RepID=UPI0025CF3711|nr:MT-A70 family methyltransferase [uncultured Draconibacterium sp.]
MGKYQVIYADPPWDQKGGKKWRSDKNGSLNLPYPTMSVEEIANLPVVDIAASDAFLFMWTTNKYLLQANRVIEQWGFNYSTCITWKKKRMGGGLGGTVRITSEYLLFCRKGNLKATGIIPESVIEAKRPYVNGYPCHSKKPDKFYELIEQVSDGYSKLELFARNKRENWHAWGNEVESDICLL